MPTKEELMRQFSLAEEKEKKPPEAEQQQADSTQAEKPSEQQPLVPNSHEHGKKRKKRKKKFGKALFGILQDKTLNKMLNVFLICLIVNAVEYFVLINYFGIPTKGVVGKILGLLVIMGYMYTARLKPRNVGFSTNPRAVIGAVRNAVVFNLSVIPAYIIEYFYLALNGHKPMIRIFAYQAALSEVGPLYFIANILLLLIINTVSVIMLEVLFRGILIKMGKGKFGFWQTAVIVSAFYSLWYLIIPLSKVSAGYSFGQLLTLCAFYLIFEFFVSLKWCMCTRASGSVWLALFDHLFFNVLVELIHVLDNTPGLANYIDVNRNYRLIIIQVISFAFCFSYYKMKMRKKERMLQAVGIRSIYTFDSLAEMSEEDVSRHADRIKTSDGDIDAEYLKLLEKNKLDREHHR
ncbi:MAG: CPBP family intramembrane metalloprotease [Clostridia bacterium]|nr:CPBP family intramembrane metalloprotease [Clostridia bacterium]